MNTINNITVDNIEVFMYTAEESWEMSETEKVVALIKEIECWRLGEWDGCCCSSFSIRNVDVEISCGKSGEQKIVVRSLSMDFTDKESLKPIMEEVYRQAVEQSGRGDNFVQYIEETK